MGIRWCPYLQRIIDHDKSTRKFSKEGPTFILKFDKKIHGGIMKKIWWCRDNIGNEYVKWTYNKKRFIFRTEEDLAWFKLVNWY